MVNKTVAAIVLGLGLALAHTAANANIIYDVNESFGGGSITGTVTTDGTLGTISTITPFVAWNLILNDGTNSSGLNTGNSFVSLSSNFHWLATASDLTFDHTFGNFFLFYENNNVGYWCLEGPNDNCSGFASTSNFNVNVGGNRAGQITSQTLPDTSFSAQVPEPTTLALLGLGLAGLGFSRRKQ